MSEDQIREIFRRKLNAYMYARQITPKQICDTLGVSKGSVSQWRNGTKVPRIDKIDKLARMFGCSRSDLLEEKNTPPAGDVFDGLTPDEMQQVRNFVAFVKSQRNQ